MTRAGALSRTMLLPSSAATPLRSCSAGADHVGEPASQVGTKRLKIRFGADVDLVRFEPIRELVLAIRSLDGREDPGAPRHDGARAR